MSVTIGLTPNVWQPYMTAGQRSGERDTLKQAFVAYLHRHVNKNAVHTLKAHTLSQSIRAAEIGRAIGKAYEQMCGYDVVLGTPLAGLVLNKKEIVTMDAIDAVPGYTVALLRWAVFDDKVVVTIYRS